MLKKSKNLIRENYKVVKLSKTDMEAFFPNKDFSKKWCYSYRCYGKHFANGFRIEIHRGFSLFMKIKAFICLPFYVLKYRFKGAGDIADGVIFTITSGITKDKPYESKISRFIKDDESYKYKEQIKLFEPRETSLEPRKAFLDSLENTMDEESEQVGGKLSKNSTSLLCNFHMLERRVKSFFIKKK